jgi:hypothetical protein
MIADVVDLKSGVFDTVLADEELFEVAASGVTVLFATDQDVGCERRETGGDGPDMQVVNLHYALCVDHTPADLIRVDTGRSALEEDIRRVAQESPGAAGR